MVTWYENEVKLAETIIQANVSDMEFKDEKGKIIETMPIKDLSNNETILAQQNEIVKKQPGSLDELSPKSHMLGLLLTYKKMYKGSVGNLPFTFKSFLQWGGTRTNKLMLLFKEALGDVEKKSEPLLSPTQDKPSEIHLNTQT